MQNSSVVSTSLPDCVSGVSATIPDFSREVPTRFWQPGKKLIGAIRSYQHQLQHPSFVSPILRRWAALRYYFWSVISGAEIPRHTRIAGGLLLTHPNGVVINQDAVIGPNCLIFQQVTLGVGGPIPGAPILEGHVDVGAGAKIFGGVRIGAHAKIGANAVVISDVPPGAAAVGVPARVILRSKR